jgi:hypothetical protein
MAANININRNIEVAHGGKGGSDLSKVDTSIWPTLLIQVSGFDGYGLDFQ